MAGSAGKIADGSRIDKGATLDSSCIIAQGVRLLGRVEVAKDVRIEPNTVIYGPASLGPGTFIGSNVVLGFPPRNELNKAISARGGLHEVASKKELVIGKGCVIRSGTCIYSDVSIGERVSFGHNAMVREDVQIGEGTMIGTAVIIDGSCKIGKHVSIQTGVYLCTNCTIEDSVFLGPHAVLANDKYVMQKKTRLVGPTVRQGASIGANSLLMPAVEIGGGSIVGAQSLVMRSIPPRSIYAGIPAKRLKKLPPGWRTSLLQ